MVVVMDEDDVKNRTKLKLTTEIDKAIKWFSRLKFKDSKYCNGLQIIEMCIFVCGQQPHTQSLPVLSFSYEDFHQNKMFYCNAKGTGYYVYKDPFIH